MTPGMLSPSRGPANRSAPFWEPQATPSPAFLRSVDSILAGGGGTKMGVEARSHALSAVASDHEREATERILGTFCDSISALVEGTARQDRAIKNAAERGLA
ncbi:hypothetical protein HYFRA_00010059 [Hymenoscyphus fraxineus]|uniref:Uncharacterized protein n=1 Tax=Hymenoscyphus fraxineus TaxID=746836 RepID=A0A9N9PRY5_9HELO|nr:hypothetical protein HYFRA_00010059 [Hymenoscyphus fraxineus]